MVWGFQIANTVETKERHSVFCQWYRISLPEKTRTLSISLAGLNYLLSAAVTTTMSITTGSGGFSIAPSLRYYPIVDPKSSPAMKLVHAVCFLVFIISLISIETLLNTCAQNY